MTYFGFLLQFIVIPITLLGILTYLDRRRLRTLPPSLRLISPALTIAILVVVAVTYTTPWDNYLVATGVWWYDPQLVVGITLGWVPLEEYTFFVLQTVLTGLWLLYLARRVTVSTSFSASKMQRIIPAALVGMIWLAAAVVLAVGWKPGNYLALELVWALPVIAFQLAVGGDILWQNRRLVIPVIITSTFYYSAVDLIAIHAGTWTINPELTLGFLLGGILPIEEAIFFLLTNVMLTFGMVLALANESVGRLPAAIRSALTTNALDTSGEFAESYFRTSQTTQNSPLSSRLDTTVDHKPAID
jgi:lycopene beta-cyclase